MYEIIKISGLTLIFSPFKNLETASLGIFIKTGSRYEKKNLRGIAHFLEHVMFKGTAKRTAKDIKKGAARIGGKLNAWTAFDQTMYHITALKEEFESAFELLSDLFLSPIFPEKEIEKERIVILDEIRRSECGFSLSPLLTPSPPPAGWSRSSPLLP